MAEAELTTQFLKLKEFYQEKKGECNQLKKDKNQLETEISNLKISYDTLLLEKQIIEESCSTARETGLSTLKEVSSNFIQYIFNNTTELNLVLNSRDSIPTLEVEIKTIQNDKIVTILPDYDGGGLNDVISSSVFMGLGLLFMEENKSLYLLDEPSKYISKGEFSEKYAECMDILLKNMGKQVIISTHDENLASIGNKTFYLEKDEITKETHLIS